jgi:conjugative transfer pilus assembly protein TraH
VSDTSPDPVSVPATINNLKEILYGDSNGGASGFVNVKLLRCDEPTRCLSPSTTNIGMLSLIERVGVLMTSLSSKIIAGNAEPSPSEISFINSVPVPVYQMLSVANASSNQGVASAKIGQYKEWIAIEFAHALLDRVAVIGANAGRINRFKLTEVQNKYLDDAKQQARELSRRIDADRAEASKRAAVMVTIAQDVEQMQRTVRAAQSQQVADLLSYEGK